MNLGGEMPPPPIQTPKKLVNQAAEAIAKQIICNCQPALKKYLFNLGFSSEDVSRNSLIEHLQKVKSQFWDDDDERSLVEPYRRFVSDALTYVMELQFYTNRRLSPDPTSALCTQNQWLLLIFCTQVLLTYEAGYSSMMDMSKLIVVRSKESKICNELLESLAPFNLRKLSTAFIKFEDPAAVVTIVKNSRYLKHIHLVNNICNSIFNSLSTYCKHIEIVYMKLFSYCIYCNTASQLPNDFLFRTFFGGLNMDYVLQNIDNKEKLVFSFPNLKEVSINKNYVNTHIPSNEFMFCLQHLYPNIRTMWFKYIHICPPGAQSTEVNVQIPSPFINRDRTDMYKWDGVQIGFSCHLPFFKIDKEATYPTVNHFIFEYQHELNSEHQQFIEELIRKHKCNSLELVIYRTLDLSCEGTKSSFIINLGKTLQKLRLHLPLGLALPAYEIIAAINACPSLKVLNIEARTKIQNSTTLSLNVLSKLNSLSVDLQKSDKPNDFGLTMKQQLIAAAPHINIIKLSSISDEELERMIDEGHLSEVNTIQIGFPFPRKLKYYLKKLASLSLLVLNYEKGCSRSGQCYELQSYFHNTSFKIICVGKTIQYPWCQHFESFL